MRLSVAFWLSFIGLAIFMPYWCFVTISFIVLTTVVTYIFSSLQSLLKKETLPANAAVVISGTSSGFGRLFTLALAKKGVMVFAGVRQHKDGQALVKEAGDLVCPILLDVADDECIAAAVRTVQARLKKENRQLFAVINNAGYNLGGPLEWLKREQISAQFDVNVFGAIALTNAFCPLLREFVTERNTWARVVFVGSIVGTFSGGFDAPYCATKHAIEAIGDSYRVELHPFNIHVSILQPGGFKTNIVHRMKDILEEVAIESNDNPALQLYQQKYQKYMTFLDKMNNNLASPEQAIPAALMECLLESTPPSRRLVGLDAIVIAPLSFLLPDRVADFLKRALF